MRDSVEGHLDGCPACRELVAAYARASDDSGEQSTIMGSSAAAFAPTVSSAPPPPTLSEPRVGDLIGSRYLLERIVGEGGMGVVWAARDLVGERHVALKMLKASTPELAKRSWREARAATYVGHPSLVEVLDVVAPPLSVGDAAPVLIMPLLDGESLDRVLGKRGTLAVPETVALLLPVVSGMYAAHAKGVIHRDLKPSNVFLAKDPAGLDPVVLVLDFGLAKLLGGSDEGADKLTRTGAVLGTPHYMAPEQLFGDRAIDHRADVWAIGAIFFECVSGLRPIDGKSYAQLLKNATLGMVKRLGQTVPAVDPRVASLVDRMLSVDREGRPSLGEVHASLRAL